MVLLFLTLLLFSSSVVSGDTVGHGNVQDPSIDQLGGDFSLQSSQGEFSLRDLRGKVVLLYFGYTQCPDVCPTSLAVLAQAFKELSDTELEKVQGVFVSVDPDRDSFKILDEYVGYFHPNLVGVTGSESELAKVARRYGVKYNKVDLDDSAIGYAVDHSSITYLITPQGELRFIFPHQTASFMILEAIRYVLRDNSPG
ncbi:MAG: SCO family protein [Candidatus Thiodiazotropha sp.]